MTSSSLICGVCREPIKFWQKTCTDAGEKIHSKCCHCKSEWAALKKAVPEPQYAEPEEEEEETVGSECQHDPMTCVDVLNGVRNSSCFNTFRDENLWCSRCKKRAASGEVLTE